MSELITWFIGTNIFDWSPALFQTFLLQMSLCAGILSDHRGCLTQSYESQNLKTSTCTSWLCSQSEENILKMSWTPERLYSPTLNWYLLKLTQNTRVEFDIMSSCCINVRANYMIHPCSLGYPVSFKPFLLMCLHRVSSVSTEDAWSETMIILFMVSGLIQSYESH